MWTLERFSEYFKSSLERKILVLHYSFPDWPEHFQRKPGSKWTNMLISKTNIFQIMAIVYEFIIICKYLFYFLRLFLRYVFLAFIILSFVNKCSMSFFSKTKFSWLCIDDLKNRLALQILKSHVGVCLCWRVCLI